MAGESPSDRFRLILCSINGEQLSITTYIEPIV
jgi:hypothetical protein